MKVYISVLKWAGVCADSSRNRGPRQFCMHPAAGLKGMIKITPLSFFFIFLAQFFKPTSREGRTVIIWV